MKPKVSLYEPRYKHLTERKAAEYLEELSYEDLTLLEEEGYYELEFDTTKSSDWEPSCDIERIERRDILNWDEYFAYRTTMARINGELTCDF